MPLQWYNLVAGPAPWADATSFESSTSSTGTDSAGQSWTNENHSTSYRKDLDQHKEQLSSSSFTSATSTVDTHHITTADTLDEAGNTYGAAGNGHGSFGSNSYTTAGERAETNLYSASEDYTYFYASSQYNSNGLYSGSSTGNGGTTVKNFTLNSTIYSEVSFSGNSATYERHWTDVLYNKTTETWSSSYTGLGPGGTYSGTDSFSTVNGTSYSTTGSESGVVLREYATDGVTTGYATSTSAVSYYASTTDSGTREIITSTVVTVTFATTVSTTTGTVSSSSTMSSTTATDTTYTFKTLTYTSSVGSVNVAQTTTYARGAYHLELVVQALAGEVLRVVTGTGTGLSDLDAVLGASFTQSTFNSAIYSSVQGTPYASSASTHTVTAVSLVTAAITYTVTVGTSLSFTQQSNDGWVGGTKTEGRTIYGITTQTASMVTAASSTYTYTQTGARSFVAWSFVPSTSFVAETAVGIAAGGASSSYAFSTPVTVYQWVSYVDWSGAYGETVTAYRSPYAALYIEGTGSLNLVRAERAYGWQTPQDMGSDGVQGRAIAVASSFYVGTPNFGLASPDYLSAPALFYSSEATTSNSSYTFTIGTDGVWSVTAASTTSSTSFTVVASITAGEAFVTNFRRDIYTENVSVAGGAHAHTSGQQIVTFAGGWGWRYTVGDGSSTTSYKTVFANNYTTATLGSHILAAETFRAGYACPILSEGLPRFSVLPY